MFIIINKYNIKIPDKAIIVANHPSLFDGFILNTVLKGKVIFVANARIRIKYRLLFKLFNIKSIPADSFCIRACVDIIKKGGRVCICPEGMLSKNAKGNYFKGFIKISELSRTNIFPLKISFKFPFIVVEFKPTLYYFFPTVSYRLFKEYCLL